MGRRAHRAVPSAAAGSATGESTFRKSDAVERAIAQMMAGKRCLSETALRVGGKQTGKVRDVYGPVPSDRGHDERIVIVTTDRQSGFDRNLAEVPFKGQVVNQTSVWWMLKTKALVDNALVSAPHQNVAIMSRCDVFPVEFIVRGYLTGSTSTSAWTNYSKGVRQFCGNTLREGMRKNDRLDGNIVTPTTKAASGDAPITPDEIVSSGLMTQAQWDETKAKALTLFEEGQRVAAQNGLILVDTKYEFGVDRHGRILLVDELHTPDSSRYWIADTYDDLHGRGLEPENIDKEFLRLWFKDHCDPYGDATIPEAPPHLVAELSRRYITLYERITGNAFAPQAEEDAAPETIANAVDGALGAYQTFQDWEHESPAFFT